ncbi:MAG: hypothetical protein MSA82_02310 [Oscillospiraceae bacterium]|nr:hypothetical protein [Oscillospiraceae bacterium]
MNVGEIVYKILGDDADFKKVMGNVGKLATKTMSVIAEAALAASAAAATAVGVLAKNAIESYGEYEQLVGGVETLFGDSADVIQGYAEEAFSTVGMSCNAYMETVTGFAASLVSSLDGDTAKAAEKANTAVSDMADNANKMGTDLQSIQNAYQGFAKQNYTMLDNLKLGYGGTKEEMERLLGEAEKIQKTKFGIDVDYDVSSFSDIVDAIHVIQEDMGITGTTAKEASTTIQGSISTMKAAWQNLMTGIADPTQDFDKLLSDVIDSVVTVSNNLMPRIMAVLPQMATGVTQLAEGILPLIPDTLNAMLPDVIDGANSLIAALLDTLSSIADTAIPIVTENADAIIDALLNGLIAAIPNLASSMADLCTALITAILDNADIITQGAVDVVVALANGISENLDTLVPAAVRAILTIVDTLIYNIDEILDAAEELIRGLADGLIDALPELLAKAPEIVIDLIAALTEAIPDTIEFAVELCERIASNIANYDWESVGSDMYQNLHNALENALQGDKDYVDKQAEEEAQRIKRYSNLTQEQLDKMIADNSKKLGEWNDVQKQMIANHEWDRNLMPQWMQREMDNIFAGSDLKPGEKIDAYLSQSIANVNDTIDALYAAKQDAVSEIEKLGTSSNFSDDAAKRAEEEAKKHFEGLDKAASEEVENLILTGDELKEAVTAIDNAYALGNYDSEKQYWADRLALLEANRNEEDQQWIKYYSQTKQHYGKAVETENKAQEQAKKDAESKLKESVENKFRELETEQLQKGYDDSWLLEQERAFLETLDHNSETYKDYNLKLLKEQQSYDEKAAKEAETAAKKQRDAVEKSYDSIVKSRDSLAKSLSSGGDIFSSSEETDKRTGAKTKKRSIDLAGFEKKIEAKKKLTSKIAELIEKNTPDDIITELLKQDPEDALAFANELLKSPDKLKKLSEGIQNDDAYSKIIANMVTENSDEFKQLGTDAGTVFGEGFMAAFQANWEESFKSVFDDDYVDTAAANVTAANSSAGISANTAAANTTASDSSETTSKKSVGTSGGTASGTYRVVDINGKYVATVVNNENARSARTGGR